MSEPLDVIVAGGSIAGLAAGLSLHRKGCNVIVFERASAVVTAGAGLALDGAALQTLRELCGPEAVAAGTFRNSAGTFKAIVNRQLHRIKVPMVRDWTLLPSHSAHWSTVRQMLLNAAPEGFVRLNHTVTGFQKQGEGKQLTVFVEDRTDAAAPKQLQIPADFLVAADGSSSPLLHQLAPVSAALRYAGYCSWRGVVDGTICPQVASGMQKLLPGLGFNLLQMPSSHLMLYKLPGNRLAWVWYVTCPQPKMQRPTTTLQPSRADIDEIYERADNILPEELAALIKATKKPLVNAIFDRNPLQQLVWDDCVVLVGEAAHPCTPHAARSTSMAIGDANALASAVASKSLPDALQAYQDRRLVTTAKHVMFSRLIGQLRQGQIGKGSDPSYWLNGITDTEARLTCCDLSCFDGATKLAKEASL